MEYICKYADSMDENLRRININGLVLDFNALTNDSNKFIF